MESGFAPCCAFTRLEEGGYVSDPRDSGNWSGGRVGDGVLIGSNMGVGAPALIDWLGRGVRVTAEQMRKLPLSTYEAIARCKYWTPLDCSKLPAGLDLMVFDFGWNRGVLSSRDLLGQCLGAAPQAGSARCSDLSQEIERVSLEHLLRQMSGAGVRTLQQALELEEDGIAGPETIRSLEACQELRVAAAVLALSALQVISYRRLANFSIYGAGWLARTARRQAASLAAARPAPRLVSTNT